MKVEKVTGSWDKLFVYHISVGLFFQYDCVFPLNIRNVENFSQLRWDPLNKLAKVLLPFQSISVPLGLLLMLELKIPLDQGQMWKGSVPTL